MIVSALLVAGCGATSRSAGKALGPGVEEAYQVLLFPETNAGWAGWCFFATAGVTGDGACRDALHHAPVIDETWSGGEDPLETIGVAVTTDEVARVEIGEGISAPTQAERVLPRGLRAAVIKVNGRNLMGSHVGRQHFIPLNSEGAVIPQPRRETAEELGHEIPTRSVSDPANPSQGICEIKMRARPNLSADGGSVVTEVHGYTGIVSGGFITCASTSYELKGWPLLASLLISASHPGAPPPELPEMKPLPDHPGVFSMPEAGAPGLENELYARRVRGGWLVVGRAKPSERLALLGDLSTSISA